ncbi:MAG TPA: hypothetical protein ACFYEK_18155 [Candidatus Wunengus sp. YC60]|uniref:hypothetical protein n=1 Tax=Candidatus Wunengus sp. YC60 TaxID=3367697 RepID=UPI004026F4E1
MNSFDVKPNNLITSGLGETVGNLIGKRDAQITGRIIDIIHGLVVPGPLFGKVNEVYEAVSHFDTYINALKTLFDSGLRDILSVDNKSCK